MAFQCQAVIAQRRPTVLRGGGGRRGEPVRGIQKRTPQMECSWQAKDTVDWLADNAGSQN